MQTFLTTMLLTIMLLTSPAYMPVRQAVAGSTVTEEGVRRVVSEFLQKKNSLPGVEINIRRMVLSGKVSLSVEKAEYEVIAPQDWEGWGRGSLAVIIRTDGRVVGNIPVYVDVEALADVVVTVRPLERGMVVEKGDVALQKRDLASMSGRICRDVNEVLGKQVRVGMRGNAPVRGDYLQRLPLVQNGKLVTIVAENDMFRITSTGKVKGSGAEGDTIMVQRTNSGRDIPAVVVDADTVRVEF